MMIQVAQPPVMAAIQCAPRTQQTPTPDVSLVGGRYLLVVQSKQVRTQGTLRLWPTGDTTGMPLSGTSSVDFRPVGARVDSAMTSTRDSEAPAVVVFNGTRTGPTTVLISGDDLIVLTVFRQTPGGFDGTWGTADTSSTANSGSTAGSQFCALRALNRSP